MSRVHLTQDFEEQELSAFKTDIALNETFRFHMLNLGFIAECDAGENTK